ncbi:MAG: 2-aminoethylphosphonate--pyruvate transaminase, partial [Pandoraea sp.]|nr:2-aminoethylphosphonate--pyruvate transaminase [Pandoraea sp.]
MILGQEPILLTPGPLTTSPATRQAMLRDWGSWDAQFNRVTASLCRDLVDIVQGGDTHVCVPLQGSGTFSVEAAIGTLTPRDARILVPDNGAYCQRLLKICRYLGRDAVALPIPDDQAASAIAIDEALTR